MNYTKSPCIIFYTKRSWYSHYLNWLRKELIHFGLIVSPNFSLEVLGHFGLKKSYKKNLQYSQNFKLYQMFVYNFLWQNITILTLYIFLTRRINKFWLKGIKTFWSGNLNNIHRDFLNYSSLVKALPCPAMQCQIVPKSSFLHSTQTTYYLINPILCHYPFQLINF